MGSSSDCDCDCDSDYDCGYDCIPSECWDLRQHRRGLQLKDGDRFSYPHAESAVAERGKGFRLEG